MKRYVNVRLPVIAALALCSGIAFGIIMYFYNLNIAWTALFIIPSALIVLIWSLVKRNPIKALVFVFLPLFLLIGGSLNSYFGLYRYDSTEIKEETEYSIFGKVTEKGKTTNADYIVIDNLMFDGKRSDGKMYVYLSGAYGELCDIGYSVDFSETVEKLRSFEYGELNSYSEQNIKYRCYVDSGLKSTYGFSLFGSIRARIHDILFQNLDKNTAAVSYAMLTGNTNQVDEQTLDSFRYGGVAHIFAVSGLHIGIIFALITFILKKLKINRYISTLVSLISIFFYSALCGFTPSSLRAAIMCSVAGIVLLFHLRPDGLNSLAIAVILILSINPLTISSIGFQLSVCAIGGILCLSKCIEKLLLKIKLPKKLSSAVGASFGAQLGTMPVMLSSFGYISGIGLLLNIVVLPVLSIIFALIFLTVFICMIVPVAGPILLPYITLPLQFIISVFIGTGFENALISGFGAGLFVPIYFVCILAISDKINLKVVTRIIAMLCGAIILISYVLIQYNLPFRGYKIIVSGDGKGGEVILKSQQGTVLILTDDILYSKLKDILNRHYCQEIDAIIILGYDSLSVYPLSGVECDNIYLCHNYPEIQPYGSVKVNYVGNFTICGIDFEFNDPTAVVAEIDGIRFGICSTDNNQFEDCRVIVSDYQSQSNCETEVFFNNRYGSLNVFDCGDIVFSINDGAYRLENEIPPKR